MNFRRAFLLLSATLIASAPVHAALNITTYTDRALFNAAVSDQHVETFEAQSLGSASNRGFPGFRTTNYLGALYVSSGASFVNLYGENYLQYSDGLTPSGYMRVTFDQPTNAFGFDWSNTDGSDTTRMRLEVPGGQSFDFAAGANGFFGIVIHDGGAIPSVIIYDLEGQGGGKLFTFNMDNVAFAESDSALFRVNTKFTPASSQTVNVKLTCNTGHEREQTATIVGGDYEGVVFVLTDIPLQGADCTVIEEGNPNLAGYTSTYTPNPCSWSNVQGGDPVYTCTINNFADPVTYGFTKVWNTDGDGGLNVVRESNVGIQCTAPIINSTPGTYHDSTYVHKWVSKSTTASKDYWVEVLATGTTPVCWSFEDAQDSAIEVTKSGACGRTTINIGGSVRTCTITNTVFFEGIPTLSQYGLAIMALLMLGVGFVGFRRFV